MYTAFMGKKAKASDEILDRRDNASVTINVRPDTQEKLKDFVETFGGTQRAVVSRLIEWFMTIPPEQAFSILRNVPKQTKQDDLRKSA